MKTRLILTACAAALLLLAGCSQPAATTSGSSLDELFLTRRSVRSYDASKTISEAEVRTIIEAAQQAPTWANTQTTRFYVAISPDKVAAVKDCVGERNAANEIGNEWGAYDNGLNNAYFILKARDMGFDWMQIWSWDWQNHLSATGPSSPNHSSLRCYRLFRSYCDRCCCRIPCMLRSMVP